MNVWMVIGLILAGIAGGLYYYWNRQQAKKREEARRESELADPSGDTGPGPSSKSGSASGWLRSLVKADIDDKKARRGGR